MMTKLTHRLLAALVLPLLLLTTACESPTGVSPEASESESGLFTIKSSQVAINPTTVEGTFVAEGLIADQGVVKEVLDASGSMRAVAVLPTP